jgi:hypothetical protein
MKPPESHIVTGEALEELVNVKYMTVFCYTMPPSWRRVCQDILDVIMSTKPGIPVHRFEREYQCEFVTIHTQDGMTTKYPVSEMRINGYYIDNENLV